MKKRTFVREMFSVFVPLLFAVAYLFSSNQGVSAAVATIEQGAAVTYQGTTTCPFYVDGRLAYCAEHRKDSPATGETVEVISVDNDMIKTLLYYGWGGDGNIFTDYSQGIVTTHHAVSHVYTGEWIVENHRQIAEGFVNFARDNMIHDMNISFDKNSVQAVLDGECQRTESIVVQGDSRNTLQFSLPENVVMHMEGTEETRAGAVVVKGGEKFYFTAPLEGAKDFSTGNITGSMGVLTPLLLQSREPQTQTCVMMTVKEKGNPTSLDVRWVSTGSVRVQKKDAETGATTPQGSGSFAGAVYTLYDGSMIPAAEIVLDESGQGKADKIPVGEYTLTETKAPAGYFKDPTTYSVSIKTDQEVTIESKDFPVRGNIEIHKVDRETGQAVSQIAGKSFAGAVYEVFQQDTILGQITLNDSGYGRMDDLLHGTYQIREIKAPEGYLLDDTVYTVQISDTSESKITYLTTSSDLPIRGSIEIAKFLEDSEETAMKDTVKGICFTITNVNDPEQIITIVTNDNGFAATDARALLYGTYRIEESNTPEGFIGFPKGYTVEITQDSQKLQYIIENNRIKSPVRIIKAAKDTGKLITQAAAEFKIQQKDQDTWSDVAFSTGHNLLEDKIVILKTDESGSVMLPEMLKTGQYRVVEVKAPQGYALNENPVEFEITKNGGWDDPMEITVYDDVVTGKIKITKVDAETGEILGNGFEFRILAAEEIVTADGTTRLRNGEEAEVITTNEEGIAESKDLYPGKYVIREVNAADGYMISEEDVPIQVTADGNTNITEIKIENKKKPKPTPTITPAVTATPTPAAAEKELSQKIASVQTGDHTFLAGFFLLAVVSLAGVVFMKTKKHSHR